MRTGTEEPEFLFDLELVPKRDSTSTFIENVALPVHRWFRYTAGFSAAWARSLIEREKDAGRRRVLDPFAGSGTVLLEAEHCGIEGRGVEAHPFIVRVAKAKLHWSESPTAFSKYALSVLDEARSYNATTAEYPALIKKCYTEEALQELDALKAVWQVRADETPISELTWLALASILRECSHVGTAQWQYVLPNKRKRRLSNPFKAFENKVHIMSSDMTKLHQTSRREKSILTRDDARLCKTIPDAWAQLVITSPPYANNYDYGDATRIEMSFFGEIQNWGDLQEVVRKYLVRSCTQHVAPISSTTSVMMEASILKPIKKELAEVCGGLFREKQLHGGKKQYDTMIVAYFTDLAQTLISLRRVTTSGALLCFVIGDSAPYGVYVPVDRWLGELALEAGFNSFNFEKTRDRNIKWKNRKHTVPLHEGRLWING